MSDDKVQGPELVVETLKRWILTDRPSDQMTVIFFAEMLPDGLLAIRRTTNGAEPKGAGQHLFSVRDARMLKVLLDAVLRDV